MQRNENKLSKNTNYEKKVKQQFLNVFMQHFNSYTNHMLRSIRYKNILSTKCDKEDFELLEYIY